MAITCPVGFDADRLAEDVRATYARVARDPSAEFHFHRGPAYACELLGYERAELDALPAAATAAFAGVGNPHLAGPLRPGETVLDVGCGAGTDLLLAARRLAPDGRALGVDVTPAMRRAAAAAARESGLGHVVEVRGGSAEALPVNDGTVDVVQSNGVLNLTPDKGRAFEEIFRVLRPGGRLHLADVVIGTELKEDERRDVSLWVA
ncbi:MAG TPA: methyltransferase domain-containing protein [Thermoanaerobaculia bacterium]|nr:methyltransferase domain-containing protein [Thermoanaerobaculia bacterium]